MDDPRPHVLIAGVSTRALAASACRAGYRVTAVDAFGDADLHAVADVVPLRRDGAAPYTAALAAKAARASDATLVAYTSNFENHPGAVTTLARGRRLLGNPPAVLERVRNPILLMRALAGRGFAVPATRASAPSVALDRRRWLLKPRSSGGGHGTSPWRRGRPVSRRHYLQERIAGVPGSVVFAADGHRATVLGLSRQLVGEPAFGARGFRYCGSLLAAPGAPLFERQAELLEVATELASAVSAAFGLWGLNTLDFIARGGVPFPIEVNPRYSASMELVERATGVSLFALHVDACAGRLPTPPRPATRIVGKAIVFARHDLVVDQPRRWTDAELADVPHPGERILRGQPICTVLAAAPDAATCGRALEAAAASIYRACAKRAGTSLRRGAA
jgi:predicted ATP-grasp superfamily ATP-dependent carboligase